MPWPKFENATAQDIRTTVAGQKPVTVPKPMTLLLKSFLCRGYFRHFARLFLFGADSAFGHGSKLGTSKWNGLRFKICRSQAHEILTPMHLNIFNLIDLYTHYTKPSKNCLFASPVFLCRSGGLSVEVGLLRLLDFLRNFWAAKKILMN